MREPRRSGAMWAMSLAGLLQAAIGLAQPTPTSTPPPPRPTTTARVVIRGHVAAGPGCAGDRAGVRVTRQPAGESVSTDRRGRFEFAPVSPRYYFLTFEPNCPVLPCYPNRSLYSDGSSDIEVEICRDDCPATVLLSTAGGVPGDLVDVSGRCEAARNGTVEIRFDDQVISKLAGDADGVYRGIVTVPEDATPGTPHVLRVMIAGGEIARREFFTHLGPQPCACDCNGDGAVTVDELTRSVRLALGFTEPSPCLNSDPSGNGRVAIEELVLGVQRALNGCPLPDLAPVEIGFAHCLLPGCTFEGAITSFMRVCVENRGIADSGRFLVRERGGWINWVDGLAAGARHCSEFPFVATPFITVDPDRLVAESDEQHNTLDAVLSAPTDCEVAVPLCTPLPTETAGPTPSPT
jgi:hypothetical protein